MKKSSIILITVVVVIVISAAVISRKGSESDVQVQHKNSLPSPTAIQTDPVEVFQKAFWKRPTDADKILHAERREWTEVGDIKKWEWFLVVEPSPTLFKYLIEENAFNLPASQTAPPPVGAPTWFKYDSTQFQTIGATRAGLKISFDKTTKLLYATDSGGGFQSGTPEKSPIAAQAPAASRIPLTSPPHRANP